MWSQILKYEHPDRVHIQHLDVVFCPFRFGDMPDDAWNASKEAVILRRLPRTYPRLRTLSVKIARRCEKNQENSWEPVVQAYGAYCFMWNILKTVRELSLPSLLKKVVHLEQSLDWEHLDTQVQLYANEPTPLDGTDLSLEEMSWTAMDHPSISVSL